MAYKQELTFGSFNPERIVSDLHLAPPAFTQPELAFSQLGYLGRYLSDPVLSCKSWVLEHQYIDRDHMEDHSVFYSRTLYPYPNYCRRVHFFSCDEIHLQKLFDDLYAIAEKGRAAFDDACKKASSDHYLGFSVIKPLSGSPVGRTVLRCFPPTKLGDPGYERVFSCTQTFRVHLAGLELSVQGLPFQQQDEAVAACATTALWSALHRARAFEEISSATPAQITSLASRNSLIFGRAMPSEGLSVDQMCQAVQAVGVSPVLRRAIDYRTARGMLYSSLRSGIAPVLILKSGHLWHAIVGVGMGIRKSAIRAQTSIADEATTMEAIYVH